MKPRHLIAATIGLAIAYPLSIGPFVRVEILMNRYADPSNPFKFQIPFIYTPLFWACRKSHTAEQAMEWYLGVWLANSAD